MVTKTFSVGRIVRADYNESTRQLDLHFQEGTVRSYQAVPNEVFRRFCNAPNPTTYWEDRIAEEYVRVSGRSGGDVDSAKKALDDLFG